MRSLTASVPLLLCCAVLSLQASTATDIAAGVHSGADSLCRGTSNPMDAAGGEAALTLLAFVLAAAIGHGHQAMVGARAAHKA
mmetsp:Transcript_149411/g.416434  ORF Transcript_149411/g.416434 Transcript_149411/m.416434 type:complete len:83 (+) Transcript_149411:164-412(+)